MASNALKCDICYNVFSDENCPRNLPCTHTFCGLCIDRIIVTQMKTCPTCRKEFTATSAEDLMKNRSLLDVVKQLSTLNVKPKIKKIRKKCTMESIQDVENRVLEKLKILEEMKNVFPAIDALNKMKDGVLNIKKEVVRYGEVLRDIERSIEHIQNKITESGDHLEAMNDQMLNEPLQDAPEKVKEIKDLLQKNQIEREDINKGILRMKRKLKGIADCIEKTSGIDPAVEEARFAMNTIGGEHKVAPVRGKQRNLVRQSYLGEVDVTPKDLVLKHKALMTGSSRRAFLDLAVGGTFLARIIIRVIDEGNLALHFLHVCAGDLGPSYAKSRISYVGDKGQAGEYIFVDGYGGCGTPVMEVDWTKEEQREIYKQMPYKAGEVVGVFSDGMASMFWIITRDDPNCTKNNCFGIVEEGLDALRDAISRYQDITVVQIVDCGLMFPL